MTIHKLSCVAALAALLLTSCASKQNFVYLNDMQVGEQVQFDLKHEATILPDDRVGITVSCKTPELAIPFNAQSASNIQVNSDGQVSASGSSASGYRVDSEGNIEFPLLGKLHLGGLTLNQAQELIEEKIRSGNYISDPLVSMEFQNFKYTVLGAVGSNGTFTVKGDRITLIEAIAQAGDLAENARIDRIVVIRQNGNKQEKFYHDLSSKSIFNSPCYYLQQNDIVYVEPKYLKKDREERALQYGTLGLSAITSVCTILYLLLK